MKSSFKGFFVVLAIMMSFVLVQGVWARDLNDFEVLTYIGEVTSVNETTRAIELDENSALTFDQMGPLWYWDLFDPSYPAEGDLVAIDAFYCDILGVYVGVSVCYFEDPLDPPEPPITPEKCTYFIELRDPDTLKPLWNQNAKMTDLSDTSAEATGDGVPNDYNYNYDYNWKDSGEPAPHGKNDS